VHRDVSPQNVFVTYDGHVKLTDFGVAKAQGRLARTETGTVKGKIAYASPEQLRGEELDRRSDVFALGTVLWELATAKRLFKGDSDAETLHRIYTGYRKPASQIVDGFPIELERIIDRALAHDRGDRYPDAASLAADLDAFVGSSVGLAQLRERMQSTFASAIRSKDEILRQAPIAEAIAPQRPKSRLGLAVGAAVVIAGLTTGVVWWQLPRAPAIASEPPAPIRIDEPPIAPEAPTPQPIVTTEIAAPPIETEPTPRPRAQHRRAAPAPEPAPEPTLEPTPDPRPSTHRSGELSPQEFFP
jgi:eukaryotic-like serine/threonine-protein kinase